MKKKFLNMILDKDILFKKTIYNKNFYIGLIVSFLMLSLYINNFNSKSFLNAINNINIYSLLLASLLLMFVVYLRAIRWRYLIHNKTISYNDLYKGQLIGYFINNVMPLRVGELAKAYYIGNKYNLSKSFIFGTVILERIFDFFGLLFVLLILFNSNLFFDIPNIFFYTVLFLFFLGLLVLYILKIGRFKNLIKKKVNTIFFSIIDGYSKFKFNNIIPVVGLTIIIWSIYILEVYLVQNAFNLNLTIHQTTFILFISSLAMSLPALPGNFGTFEGSVHFSLSLFNIDDNFGFSFILHLVSYIPYTVFGFIYCFQGIKFLLIKK